jgi:hypothetical protein
MQRSLFADAAIGDPVQAPGPAVSEPEATASAPSTTETMPARLAMIAPSDMYEREADDAADRVMRAPAPNHRDGHIGRSAAPVAAPDVLQRSAAHGGDRSTAGSATVDADTVGDALSDTGRSLDPTTRTFMETRFGQDFSHVRVHTGSRAAESARALNANAYTVGRHLVFDEGAYRPQTEDGRHLIAHELAHVRQQAASGPRLQRDEKTTQATPAGMSLDEIFDQVAAETKKPIGPKTRAILREWATKYEKKRGQKPGHDQILSAVNRWRFYQTLPEIVSDAEIEAKKHKPPVPCNQIIPYKVGDSVLITHLLDKVLPPDKIETVKGIAADKQQDIDKANKANKAGGKEGVVAAHGRSVEDIIRSHPSAVFDLIMSANAPKSATAVITQSGPEGVTAKIAMPAIPAKGDLPAYEPFTAIMALEFDVYSGEYGLQFTRMDGETPGPSFAMRELTIRKSGDTLQVGIKDSEYFKIKLAKGADGALTLKAFDIYPLAKWLLGLDDEISLINVAQTGSAPAEVEKTQAQVRSQFAPPPRTDPPKFYGGAGLQWTDRSNLLLSAGWSFTFSPGLGIVKVPLAFQFDYAPRADVFAGIYSGAQFVIPSQIPVRVSLIGGARAGSIETTAPGGDPGPRTPVAGPVVGAGVGLQLGSSVELQLDTTHMLNLIQFGTDMGPAWIPTLGLKTNLSF